MAQLLLKSPSPQHSAVTLNHESENTMKKLLVGALLAFAIPAFAHAGDEAKPADKSAKKAGKGDKKGEKKDGEEKKADDAAGDKK